MARSLRPSPLYSRAKSADVSVVEKQWLVSQAGNGNSRVFVILDLQGCGFLVQVFAETKSELVV